MTNEMKAGNILAFSPDKPIINEIFSEAVLASASEMTGEGEMT